MGIVTSPSSAVDLPRASPATPPDGAGTLIQLREIVKDYRRVRALDHVSVDFPPGVTGLLGPNGAGKSTLIKVILGLVRVTAGSGQVLGCDLRREGRRIRVQVGYLPEDDCYVAGLTGVEMVRFAACLSGMERIEGLRRAHEILDFCNVQQERYRAVETYSTGMRQKVRFAAALVHDPRLLILDEPTSGLDPEERYSMLNRIRLLAKEHDKSVIVSTHILHDVQTTCDQVVILSRGVVKLAEKLEALSRRREPTVFVRTLGDGSKMAEALRADGVNAEIQPSGVVQIAGDAASLAPRIWQAARQTNVVIQSLVSGRTSLEEIFISAVQEATDAGS